MRPTRIRLLIYLVAAAALATAGVASYGRVDRAVLTKTAGPSADANEYNTSTTVELEPTTTTTVPPEAAPSTSTTVRPPKPTTTVRPKERPKPTTPTTKRKEYPPSTAKPKPPKPTETTTKPLSTQLSLYCAAVTLPDGVQTIKCKWSPSSAPGFHHYRLTREGAGTPNRAVFETENRDADRYYDREVQGGSSYSYVIEAYDSAGTLVGRAGPFHVSCCEGAPSKT